MALVVPVQGAQAVHMNTNAPVASPRPASSAMQAMIVVVTAIQMPVGSDSHPTRTSPPLQDAQAV
jgi:hypothetical protein